MAKYCIPQIAEVTSWLTHLASHASPEKVAYHRGLRRTFLKFVAFVVASLDIEATAADENTQLRWKRSKVTHEGTPEDALRDALRDPKGQALVRFQISVHRKTPSVMPTTNSCLRLVFSHLSENGLSELKPENIVAVEDPPRTPPIEPVTDWLAELEQLTRSEEDGEEEYSASTAKIIRSQFLDYCGFAVTRAELELVLGDDGPMLRWSEEEKRQDGGEAQALERVLLAEGKETLTAYLRDRAKTLGKQTLSTLASNLRRAYAYFQEAKLTDFDPSDVKTPDREAEAEPDATITTLPIFEAMLSARYPDRAVRNSRRHQLGKYLVYLIARLREAKPQVKITSELEERALKALTNKSVKAPAVSVTKELLKRGNEHAPAYVGALSDDDNTKHLVSVVRQFYVWAVGLKYCTYDASDLGSRRSSRPSARVQRISPRKMISLRKRKRKAKTKKRVKRKLRTLDGRTATIRAAGRRPRGTPKSEPPKKLLPWGAVLPQTRAPRDRSNRFSGLDNFWSAQSAAVQQLICGPLQLDLTQVSLLGQKAFRQDARVLDVPTASGPAEATPLDDDTFAALDRHLTVVSTGGVAQEWERGNSLFVARDGGALFFDNAPEAYPAEIGFVLSRNRTATAVMRETGMTLLQLCSLKRASYDAGKLKTPKGNVMLSGPTIALFSSFFQIVRVSRSFSSYWTMMEEQHALFYACDLDNLTV